MFLYFFLSILIAFSRSTNATNECFLYSSDIKIKNFKISEYSNYTVRLREFESNESACNSNVRRPCTFSNDTIIHLCITIDDYIKLMDQVDISALSESDQTYITNFIRKLKLKEMIRKEKDTFDFMCEETLKRLFRLTSKFNLMKVCGWLKRKQKPANIYTKLKRAGHNLTHGPEDYIGNAIVDVLKTRITRNLTGKVLNFSLIKAEINKNYNESAQLERRGLLNRGFTNFVLNPFVAISRMTHSGYSQSYNTFKIVSRLLYRTRRPGDAFTYAWRHAVNNVTLYYRIECKGMQRASKNIRYVYNRIRGKLKESWRDHPSFKQRIVILYNRIPSFSPAKERIERIIKKVSKESYAPYSSFSILNDTSMPPNPNEVNCISDYWWIDIKYWDPAYSPFKGFVNGSEIDLVPYLFIIWLPPPRTCFAILDWLLAWLRRAWSVNELVPDIALDACHVCCEPPFPYFVDIQRYPHCMYPTFQEIPKTYCSDEADVVLSGDVFYCNRWKIPDDTFIGWVNFLSTTSISPWICRSSVTRFLFGWMVWKDAEGNIRCDTTEGVLPPMMGKCLGTMLLTNLLLGLVIWIILIILIYLVVFAIGEVKYQYMRGKIDANADDIEELEEEVEEEKKATMKQVKRMGKEAKPAKEVVIDKNVEYKFLKTEGKASKNLC